MRIVLLAMALATAVSAQSPTSDAGASFEVAVVKENKSGDERSQMADPPGRFSAVNVPLREMIEYAWRLRSFQLVGGPSWIGSDRFDVIAKAGPVPTSMSQPVAVPMMLRTLLANRFALVMHLEQRALPIYALTLAHRDGSLGPQLKRAAVDCVAVATGRAAGGPALSPDGRPRCGWRGGSGILSVNGFPLSQLAQLLSGLLGRSVVDRTGLSGAYDLELTYRRNETLSLDRSADSDAPDIFTAVDEQLGLKLESTSGPVDVYVIDRVQKPTPD